jgi:hypothetical protein
MLEALLGHALRQRIIARPIGVDELFARQTPDLIG